MSWAKVLPCDHRLCVTCLQLIEQGGGYTCPECGRPYRTPTGTQPPGEMKDRVDSRLTVPGYTDSNGAIVIEYNIPNGTQGVSSHSILLAFSCC